MLKVVSYLDTGDGNYWAHPIENLVAVVDLEQKKIIKIEEGPVIPVPMEPRPFDGRDRKAPAVKPLEIIEPEGKNYTITGDTIHWQNWDFHSAPELARRANSLDRDLQRQRHKTPGHV